MLQALALLLIAGGPVPFTLVNATGAPLASLSVRPIGAAGAWQSLPPGRLSPGARGAVPAIAAEVCAFDIEAEIGGNRLRWSDVNLCDVRSVTLRKRGEILWVDYD
jgi:hypothetical protein